MLVIFYLGICFSDGYEGVGEYVGEGHGLGGGALLLAARHVEFGHTVVLRDNSGVEGRVISVTESYNERYYWY